MTEEITNIFTLDISTTTSESTIVALVKGDIPMLDKYVTKCCNRLMKYTKTDINSLSFTRKVKAVLKEANTWAKNINRQYTPLEMHEVKGAQKTQSRCSRSTKKGPNVC